MTEYQRLLKAINRQIDETVRGSRKWQRSGFTITPDFYTDDSITQRERKKVIDEYDRLYGEFSAVRVGQIYCVKGWRRWVMNYEVFSVKGRKHLDARVNFGTIYPERLILVQGSPSFEFSKLPEYNLETEIHSKSHIEPVKIDDLNERIERAVQLMQRKEIKANLFSPMVPLRTKSGKGFRGIEISKDDLLRNVRGMLTGGKTFEVIYED